MGTGTASEAVRRHPASAVPAQQVVVDQHCQQLLGKQRVAVGGPGDPRRSVGGQWPAAEQVRDQSPAVAVVERLEQHRHGLDLAAGPGGMAVEELGPRRAEQQDRRVARLLGQVLDERQERRLGPLQVVEDDHERAALRDPLEELAHRPGGHLAGAGAAAAETERVEDQLADQVGLVLAGKELGDRSARRLRAGRFLAAQDLAHDLGQRPVRDALAVREAVAVQHRGFLAEVVRELLDEARLADPGRPEHCQQPAGAMVHDARERAPEHAELLLAADERRIEAAGTGRRALLGRGHIGPCLERAEDSVLHRHSFGTRLKALRPLVAHVGSFALPHPRKSPVRHGLVTMGIDRVLIALPGRRPPVASPSALL